jgi:8-amino-7-oxononanoate synthase
MLERHEGKVKENDGIIYILVESVYSMDGDFVQLEELVPISKKYNAYIILDEAHSSGIFGTEWVIRDKPLSKKEAQKEINTIEEMDAMEFESMNQTHWQRGQLGAGYAVQKGFEDQIFARIHTFGKAFGVHGACVAGPQVLIDYLTNFSRAFVYTTMMPPHAVIAISESIKFMPLVRKTELAKFWKVVIYWLFYTQRFEDESISNNFGPIQTIKCNGHEAALKLANFLQGEGIAVKPILSPTVAEGQERIRICLHAFNTQAELEQLTNLYLQYLKQQG